MKKIVYCLMFSMLCILTLSGCVNVSLTDKEYEIKGSLSSIKISEKYGDVIIEKSNKEYSYIEYKENGKNYPISFSYSEKNGSLDCFRTDARSMFQKRSDVPDAKINIYIKEDDAPKITVEIKEGNLEINGVNSEEIEVTINNGDISILNAKISGDVDLSCYKGDFCLENVNSSSLSVESDYSSNANLSEISIENELEIEGKALPIEGTVISASKIVIETMNGDVKLKKTSVKNLLDIELTTGSVTLGLNDKKENYQVDAKSGTGSSIAFGTTGTKITVNTSVGDIKITYAD